MYPVFVEIFLSSAFQTMPSGSGVYFSLLLAKMSIQIESHFGCFSTHLWMLSLFHSSAQRTILRVILTSEVNAYYTHTKRCNSRSYPLVCLKIYQTAC